MFYENKDTGVFGLTLNDVRRLLPNMSIPDNTSDVGGYTGYIPVAQPVIDWNQDVVEVAPVNGRQTWSVTTAAPEELQRRINAKAVQVRNDRDPLLRACDWTQLTDAPVDPDQAQPWRDYRRALRDVTAQPGFPWTVIWPVAPVATENSDEAAS